jgi:hypothetical protein
MGRKVTKTKLVWEIEIYLEQFSENMESVY